jgi:hypothetical protein
MPANGKATRITAAADGADAFLRSFHPGYGTETLKEMLRVRRMIVETNKKVPAVILSLNASIERELARREAQIS